MGNTEFTSQPLFGGIEAGGTKFNCIIGADPDAIYDRASFPTTTPEQTLAQARDFFLNGIKQHGQLAALGLASFGPLDLNEQSSTYGYITKTPKPGWSSTNMVGYFSDALNIPISFETDVNAAAMGEYLFGAAQDINNFVYVTVGTGIGAGVISQGQLIKGHSHPEVGHILVPHDRMANAFSGSCPFHGDCIEGLASGPALAARWGKPAQQLEADHPAWELQAHYLAMLCVNLTHCYSPEKIIMGGGVMEQQQLYEMISKKLYLLMGGYQSSWLDDHFEQYIVPPSLTPLSGELGAIALARTLV